MRRAAVRANPVLEKAGLYLAPVHDPGERFTPDFPEWWRHIIGRVTPYTMTSRERIGALLQTVEYIAANEVPGAFVECGVWRGGSTMAAALAFMHLDELRDLYLFDTFEGMSAPTDVDVDYLGEAAADVYNAGNRGPVAALRDVQTAIGLTGYPGDRVHYVKGLVEATLPDRAPDEIAILRLDTDWYESTKHELEYLWPRLRRGGVLIVDDYGHYAGCRRAVDEFFGEKAFLHRIDYTGRLVIKHHA